MFRRATHSYDWDNNQNYYIVSVESNDKVCFAHKKWSFMKGFIIGKSNAEFFEQKKFSVRVWTSGILDCLVSMFKQWPEITQSFVRIVLQDSLTCNLQSKN